MSEPTGVPDPASDRPPPPPPPPPPPQPGAAFDSPRESAGSTEQGLSKDDRLWGMLSHLIPLVGYSVGIGGILAPLVVFLVFKEKSRFVAFHALQATFLHLSALVLPVVILVVTSLATCGLGLIVVLPALAICWLGLLVYGIVAATKAYDGQLYEYWIVGRWARDQVGI